MKVFVKSMTVNHIVHPVVAVSLLLWLAACSGSQKGSVWNTYDYRHPVPATSAIPDSKANVYIRQYYQDNDSSYTPPKNYGNSCVNGNYDLFECE